MYLKQTGTKQITHPLSYVCKGLGLRSLTEKIDKDADLEEYIKTYGGRAGRTQKNEIPYKEYNMSMTAKSVLNPNPVFGVDLALLMERDREEVPLILRKCAEAVETYGKFLNRTSNNDVSWQRKLTQWHKVLIPSAYTEYLVPIPKSKNLKTHLIEVSRPLSLTFNVHIPFHLLINPLCTAL